MSPTPLSQPPRSFGLALAAVSALGPLSTDLYLASLPDIGADFSAPVWMTQMTLTGFLLVLGLAQLVAGPVSDAVGRRRMLIAGLALFSGSSLLAMVAPGIEMLILARVIQGVGAGLSFVVATSSVRDRTAGQQSAKLFAYLMTVSAAAPVLGPSLGGFIDQYFGWRPVFGALALFGVSALLIAVRWLPESLPADKRSPLSLRGTFRSYRSILSGRAFLMPLAALCACFVFLFAYIGGASYIYRGVYGLDSGTFGLVFGATGISVLLGAQLSTVLLRRMETGKVAMAGAIAMGAGPVLALASAGLFDSLPGIVVGMAVAMAGLGIGEPPMMSLAMSSRHDGLGAAAAVIGCAQFILGAAATAVVGVLAGFGTIPWILLMMAGGVAAVVLCSRIRPAGAPAAEVGPIVPSGQAVA